MGMKRAIADMVDYMKLSPEEKKACIETNTGGLKRTVEIAHYAVEQEMKATQTAPKM